MKEQHNLLASAVFVTFSGNCRQALRFYQGCFGGDLRLNALEQALPGYSGTPIINGSLVTDRICIHGSDLVPEEGRQPGNHMAIYLHCFNAEERKVLLKKLQAGNHNGEVVAGQQLVEIADQFGVRWVLGL